jgi:hypothetical protein
MDVDGVFRAIHDAVLDAGPKQLARLMGTSHTGLLNRTNPNDDTHKLNVEQLLQILEHTGDMRPLHALAELCGFELVAKEQPQAEELPQALLGMTKEVAEVTVAVSVALADGRVSGQEKALIRQEIAGVRASLDRLEVSVSQA